jgi:hypothetical protein
MSLLISQCCYYSHRISEIDTFLQANTKCSGLQKGADLPNTHSTIYITLEITIIDSVQPGNHLLLDQNEEEWIHSTGFGPWSK